MYAYNRTSNAYDLSYFDTDENAVRKTEQRREQQKSHIKLHKTSVAKSGNWFKTMVLIAFAAILAFSVINCKAQISEVATEISSKTAELEKAQEENVRLQTVLDNMVTLNKVDEIASGEMGLQKTTKNQVHYIPVYDRTMVQAAEKDNNLFVTLRDWAEGILEYLGF